VTGPTEATSNSDMDKSQPCFEPVLRRAVATPARSPVQTRKRHFEHTEPLVKRRRLTGKQAPPTPNPWTNCEAVVGGRTRASARPAKQRAAVSVAKLAPPAATLETHQRVCFTATGIVLGKRQRQLLERLLGASVVDDWSPSVTHVVASSFKRTTKLMCAVCSGASVVIPAFIDACLQAGRLVEEGPFALQDQEGEAAFARRQGLPCYSLQAAIALARSSGPLLAGKSVYTAKGSSAAKQELRLLVQAAGGNWLTRVPRVTDADARSGPAATTIMLGKFYDEELVREAACTQVLRFDAHKL